MERKKKLMEMEKSDNSHNPLPHILLFPVPAKGHIKPFLCLAELLCNSGLHVTFLNTDYNHRRIDNLHEFAGRLPTLHFQSISDGLPENKPRDLLDAEIYLSMMEKSKLSFRELIVSSFNGSSGEETGRVRRQWGPITCVITDVIFSFPIEVAEELGVPVFSFCPFSARFLFLYFSIPKLLEDGQIPYQDEDTNKEIHGVPGAEGLLRRKDLPCSWYLKHLQQNHNPIEFINQTLTSSRSSGLILNTFDELESPFLSNLSKIFKNIYTIGPIHSLLNSPHSGFWNADRNCIEWLDSQSPRSVLFVSFGTLVTMKTSQLTEFWHGLINSGKSFLFVLRSDGIEEDEDGNGGGKGKIVNEIIESEMKAGGKWMIVGWAYQEAVLAHQAIGGFLTHSGWNSTMESIAAGVPMISWPKIGDQPSNCIWACNVWKIGLEIEDRYDRATVETMVRSLMEEETGEEMRMSIVELSKRSKSRVCKGGTSCRNLERLIEDVKKIGNKSKGVKDHFPSIFTI